MNNWTIETTENFDGKGFYVILECDLDYKYLFFKVFNIGDYPRMDVLEGIDLEGIELIYEVFAKEDNDGQRIMVAPKDDDIVTSESGGNSNGLILVVKETTDGVALLGHARSKGKLVMRDKDIKW